MVAQKQTPLSFSLVIITGRNMACEAWCRLPMFIEVLKKQASRKAKVYTPT